MLAAAAPVALIPGLTGTFLRPMVLAFMLCVAVSTLVALTVTRALAAVALGAAAGADRVTGLAGRRGRTRPRCAG